LKKTILLAVVKKSLRDNSRFLEVTSLNANDLDDVKHAAANLCNDVA
jgi:hypothetical protein